MCYMTLIVPRPGLVQVVQVGLRRVPNGSHNLRQGIGRGRVRHTPQGHMGVYLPTPSSLGSNDFVPRIERRRSLRIGSFQGGAGRLQRFIPARFLKNKRGFCWRGGICG